MDVKVKCVLLVWTFAGFIMQSYAISKVIEEDEDINGVLYNSFLRSLQNESVPTTSPTPAPTSTPTFTPTVSPTESPAEAPTDSGEADAEDKRTMVYGIIGFALFFAVILLLLYNHYTGPQRQPEGSNRVANPNVVSPLTAMQQNNLSRRLSNKTGNRESLSTIFSRDRQSTWSGHFSGKIDAVPGMDDNLFSFMRDKRRDRNKKRKQKKADARGVDVSASTRAVNKRQQGKGNMDGASIQEKEINEEETSASHTHTMDSHI